MAAKEKGPAPTPSPNPTPSPTSPTSTTSVVRPATPLPGERPATLARARAQRERYGQLMGTVRQILAEQPSPATVRTVGRQITADITRLATAIAAELGERVADTGR